MSFLWYSMGWASSGAISTASLIFQIRAKTATALQIVTSVITTRSVKELELAIGSEVIAFVKSTEVSIAKL